MQTLLARTEFQTLIESVPDALLMIDDQGQIALVNQQVEALFGYKRQELLGRELECLLPERFHTLHLHHRRSYLENPKTRPMGLGLELYARRRDGSEFPVDISLSPLSTQAGLFIICSLRDISERSRLEHLARSHQALLQVALDALPMGVYVVQGEQAKLVFANRAATEVWGATWIPGQPMQDFLHTHSIRVLSSDGRELTGDQLATYRALRSDQQVHQYQEVIQRPDGTTLPILWSAVLLPAQYFQHLQSPDRQANGVLVGMQDISPLKATEQLKDEFIGLAAHELRTPLAALKGFADMLVVHTQRGRGAPLADWQEEALTEIMVATNRLIEFTEALLDVTRIQAGRLILTIEPRNLVDLVHQVVRGTQATSQQHTLHLHAEPESLIVPIDALRIEQVLTNLLCNAVKYSPDGGAIEVEIQAHWQQDQVVVQVRDHGIGIPVSHQPYVFQRFTRADNTQGAIGAGLGLYLCRELVERHGGRIWFESVEGQGSTFFVALPLSPDTSPPH
jgi:PAS domain S-box-containing protein